jgi:SAM-dependent methyltransferase
MYQNAGLAEQRDQAEKQTVLPLLGVCETDKVLDVGCGTGRWAETVAPLVDKYLGVDFSEKLLDVARARTPDAHFQCMPANSLKTDDLSVPPPFSLIICSGIFAYINDRDLSALVAKLGDIASAKSRIYIREPIAKFSRLTLRSYWSEELGAHYSAIYRTHNEYLHLFQGLPGFVITAQAMPFPVELQNREETQQWFFLLEKDAAP